jgi:hypothetical protein
MIFEEFHLGIECAWCGKYIDLEKAALIPSVLALRGNWPGLPMDRAGQFIYKDLLLCKKNIPIFISRPDPEKGDYNNFGIIVCSEECQQELKTALINEKLRLN